VRTATPTPTDQKQGRVAETIKRLRVDSTGEETEILLRRNFCPYLTRRLMPEEQDKAIRELPRDRDVVALFQKLAGADPLPPR